MKDDALKFCGLLYRGGQLVIGDTAKEKIKHHKVKLVVLASDISENSKNEINSLMHDQDIQTISFANKDELGSAVGKGSVVIYALNKPKAIEALLNKIDK